VERARQILRLLWRSLDYFGRAYVAWQLGGAAVLTAFAGWGFYTASFMPRPFLVLLGFGLFMLTFAAIGASAPFLAARLPHAPPQPELARQSSGAGEDDRERQCRVVIHEAISTLEYQRGAIQANAIFEPRYQGFWPKRRGLLAAESRYSDAFRLTERAFTAVGAVFGGTARHAQGSVPPAIEAIDRALAALNEALSAAKG